MKSSAWDNKLWQNKMQEIPLEGDANSAWSKMQGLLDEVMPVTPATPMAKTPWSLPKSWLRTIAYAAAAAAIILVAAYFLLKKQHQKPIKHHKENVKPIIHGHPDSAKHLENRNDSAINTQPMPGRVTADSLNTDAPSVKNNINTATVGGTNKTIAVNGNSKKAVADNTVISSSKHRSVLARSTTSKLSSGYANNTSGVKGRNGAAKGTSQTQNLAASSASSAGLKNIKNKGNHHFGSRRGASANNPNLHSPTTILHTNNNGENGNKNMLADDNASKTNGLIKPNSTPSPQKGNKPASSAPVVQLSKADSSKMAANKGSSAPKQATTTNAAIVKNKPLPQTSIKNTWQTAYSKFGVAIEAGINSGKGSTTPFVGLSGSYAVDPKFSISIGGNIFSSRTITGKYNIGKYQYTTQDSTGHITSHTAKNILVSTSQKLHTLEVPLMASYKLTKWLTIKGGPVISIPIKIGAINNTLAPVDSPLDTARAFKTLSSTVNSTGIINKVNFNLSGGVLINIKRLYFDASYVQETGPYTIFSSLGSGNTYYHYLQIGIGYKLFQSKPKPNHN